jgi:hypothetical protein
VHLATGTVQVSAVGMFAGGAGFAIAPPTLASLVVVVGGLSRRPIAVDDQIVIPSRWLSAAGARCVA